MLTMRLVTRFLHPDNLVLRFFAVGIGVVVQNGLYIGLALLLEELAFSLAPIKQAAMTQLFWALGTGFILVTFFRHAQRIWDDFLNIYFVREVG
jgi:hypothetical protein